MPRLKEVTWYIEARPWSGQPGQPPGFAVADPARMGSGVVVKLELLDAAGQRRTPRDIRNYLLTCAHVVRDGQNGAQFEEIFCWNHQRGYSRTEVDQRRSGVHAGACLARVSAYSPCGGVAGASPAPAIDGNDWALLELDDPRFQKAPAVESWADVSIGKGYSITGYPGGAGKLASRGHSHFWETGDLTECLHSDPFEVCTAPVSGTFHAAGSGKAGAGMSGGGAFDADCNLVGLHRASELAALQYLEIELASIFDWLRTHHGLVPVAPKSTAVVRKVASKDPTRIDVPVLGSDPKIAFFNRSKLRANLKRVASAGNQYRVIWLDGDKGSGKSHSWFLLHHASEEFGIRCAFLDVSEGAQLDDACAGIVGQLGLDGVDFENFATKDAPTMERLGKKLVQWLAKATAASGDRYWIVFDGLSPSDHPSSLLIEHLVTPFVKAMIGNSRLPRVTLALLGGDFPRAPSLRPFVLDEQVEAPGREDVEKFVVAYAADLGRSLSSGEVAEVVDAIAGADPGPYRGEALEELRLRAVDVVAEVIK